MLEKTIFESENLISLLENCLIIKRECDATSKTMKRHLAGLVSSKRIVEETIQRTIYESINNKLSTRYNNFELEDYLFKKNILVLSTPEIDTTTASVMLYSRGYDPLLNKNALKLEKYKYKFFKIIELFIINHAEIYGSDMGPLMYLWNLNKTSIDEYAEILNCINRSFEKTKKHY